jgi:hypothetical protein
MAAGRNERWLKDNGTQRRSLVSYSEARNLFEKARNNGVDQGTIDLLEGLKHLSHAIEEDIRTVSQGIRDIRDSQNSKQVPSSFS